jgi:hypothetical protein
VRNPGGVEHAFEVVEVVAVFACGDLEREGFAQLCEAGEVVGGDGLLEPRDVEVVGESQAELASLGAAVGAV